MKSIYTTVATAALMLAGAPALTQETPAGAWATGCDVSHYIPIISERTGEVLYWNNRRCPAGVGATDTTAAAGGGAAGAAAGGSAGGGGGDGGGGGGGDGWQPGDGPPPWAGGPGGNPNGPPPWAGWRARR